MNDLISREATIDAMENTDWYHQNQNGEMVHGASSEDQAWYKAEDVYGVLERMSSTHPERKKGKWLLSDEQRREDTDNDNYLYFCSNCLHSDIHAKTQEVPYCWWCGANMRGEQDE